MSEESKLTPQEVSEWPPFEEWLARELEGSDIKPEAIQGDARLFATRAWFCGGLAYHRLATEAQRLLSQLREELAQRDAETETWRGRTEKMRKALANCANKRDNLYVERAAGILAERSFDMYLTDESASAAALAKLADSDQALRESRANDAAATRMLAEVREELAALKGGRLDRDITSQVTAQEVNKMKFYMVCAWDQYYPYGGIDNIKAVFQDKEAAERYLDELQNVNEKDRWELRDHYEIFSSDELPWYDDK